MELVTHIAEARPLHHLFRVSAEKRATGDESITMPRSRGSPGYHGGRGGERCLHSSLVSDRWVPH